MVKVGLMVKYGRWKFSAIRLTIRRALCQSSSLSPRKPWNTVPPVYRACSESWWVSASKMSSVVPTGSWVELV